MNYERWLERKHAELKINMNHPEIKLWDIYNFIKIIDKRDRKIEKLQKLLKYNGLDF